MKNRGNLSPYPLPCSPTRATPAAPAAAAPESVPPGAGPVRHRPVRIEQQQGVATGQRGALVAGGREAAVADTTRSARTGRWSQPKAGAN